MSIAMAQPHANKRGIGVSTRLSRELLLAGLMGAHMAAFIAVPAFLWLRSPVAAASAAVAAVVVIAFFTIGHAVVIRFAEVRGISVLIAALASYAVRVTTLGVLLSWYSSNNDAFVLDPIAVSVGIIATCLGWLTAEIWRFTRLRIPVYDDMSTGGEA